MENGRRLLLQGFLILLLVASFFITRRFIDASAHTLDIPYIFGIQIANLETLDAELTFTVYNPNGIVVTGPMTDTLPANGSKTYFPFANTVLKITG